MVGVLVKAIVFVLFYGLSLWGGGHHSFNETSYQNKAEKPATSFKDSSRKSNKAAPKPLYPFYAKPVNYQGTDIQAPWKVKVLVIAYLPPCSQKIPDCLDTKFFPGYPQNLTRSQLSAILLQKNTSY